MDKPEIEEIKEEIKRVSLRLVIIAAIFLLSVILFIFIADKLIPDHNNLVDVWAFREMSFITNPVVTRIMIFLTFFGSPYFLFPAYILLILYFLLYKRNKRLSLDVGAFAIISTALLFSLKAFFNRPRPTDQLVHTVYGLSFPSGHSFSSFTFFGLLIYIIRSSRYMSNSLKWGLSIAFSLLACIIAISRVYLHVHYATDVIGGLCLCIVWLVISIWLIHKIRMGTSPLLRKQKIRAGL